MAYKPGASKFRQVTSLRLSLHMHGKTLDACMHHSFRFCPPGRSLLPRCLLPPGLRLYSMASPSLFCPPFFTPPAAFTLTSAPAAGPSRPTASAQAHASGCCQRMLQPEGHIITLTWGMRGTPTEGVCMQWRATCEEPDEKEGGERAPAKSASAPSTANSARSSGLSAPRMPA